MHRKNVVIALIGIAILVVAVVAVIIVLKGPDPFAPLILDAIAIRNVGNNSIAKAKIIDDMDKNIEKIKDKETLDKWEELTNCLDAGCVDDVLFDFVLSIAIAHPDKVPSAKFVADMIVVGRFWGSGDVLKFSKALTSANEAVAAINSKDIDKKWDQIVACNGACAEKNNLIFDEIKLVVEKGTQK